MAEKAGRERGARGQRHKGERDQTGCGPATRETLSHPNRSPGTRRRDAAAQEQPVRIAPHLLGLLPARRRRSAAVELGAARPPLSPARCAAAGSRGGLCSGGAGQDPSPRRPRPPELGKLGVGTGRRGRGPEERRRAPWSLGFPAFALFVIELFSFGAGAGRRGRCRTSGKGAPALRLPRGRARLAADPHCVRVCTAGGAQASVREESR